MNNMTSDIYNDICHALSRHEGVVDQQYDKQYNFVQESVLDSFALLSFISDVEEVYSIQLLPEELLSNDSHTVDGLVKLIARKQQEL